MELDPRAIMEYDMGFAKQNIEKQYKLREQGHRSMNETIGEQHKFEAKKREVVFLEVHRRKCEATDSER